MTTTILEFRVRGEEMAGAVLKEVAALEPAERLEGTDSLTRMVAQAVQSLDELWEELRGALEAGISPSDAAALERILTRCANLSAGSLELLTRENPSLEEFRKSNLARLEGIKLHAASLRRLIGMPAPVPDPERLRRSLEELERDDGVDAEALCSELKG
ncbi:MAG TPA: hypothetical protein VFA18_18320 [Gemmataceae bacterium]|nr:hypothetical protein [Gemmataceae bacterium]